jgi:hypothetical protein
MQVKFYWPDYVNTLLQDLVLKVKYLQFKHQQRPLMASKGNWVCEP